MAERGIRVSRCMELFKCKDSILLDNKFSGVENSQCRPHGVTRDKWSLENTDSKVWG